MNWMTRGLGLGVLGMICAAAPGALAAPVTILVDFGGAATDPADDPARTWNNLSTALGTTNTGVLADLKATNGTTTAADIAMVARFNGVNAAGTTASSLYPADATNDSLYGNQEAFGIGANITPIFKIAGLNPDEVYDLTFYASRVVGGANPDNRTARYTLLGDTTSFVELNATDNINNTITATGVGADSNGEIRVTITAGTGNNNANHFAYLGVLTIAGEIAPVPEPTTGALLVGGAMLALRRRARRA
ncbi:MAG TPA: PEP-CTERM sorting domain-containing protein [Tepidisphaeraceae bacterium]|nr:PEP-CTERM sorting domain-containing protein [Tepidisphaeraceae bacterium]